MDNYKEAAEILVGTNFISKRSRDIAVRETERTLKMGIESMKHKRPINKSKPYRGWMLFDNNIPLYYTLSRTSKGVWNRLTEKEKTLVYDQIAEIKKVELYSMDYFSKEESP